MNDNLNEDLYLHLIDIIKDFYDDYAIDRVTKEEYNKIVCDLLKTIEEKNIKEEQLIDYFENKMIVKLRSKRKCEARNEHFKIEKYITDNLDLSANLMDEFLKFCMYTSSSNIALHKNRIVNLLNSNTKFNSLVEKIVKENYELIINDNFCLVVENQTALNIVDIYCTLNNINVKKVQEEKINLDNENRSRKYDDNFSIFMREVNEYKQLTDEEIYDLKQKVLAGDTEARKKIINSNLKLVVDIAINYQNNGLEFLDLIQEGSIGLIKSIESFDPSLGFKFSTYASRCIKSYICRAIENKGRTIRIPANLSWQINKYLRVFEQFEINNGRPPTLDELEQILGVKKEKIIYIQKHSKNVISYNFKVSNDLDEDTELAEFLCSEEPSIDDIIIKNDLNQGIKYLFKKANLKQREIDIITLVYGLDGKESMVLREIGKKYGLSRERIRQIVETVFRKIRKNNEIYRFAVYMDNPIQSKENIISCRNEYKKHIKYKKLL